MLTTAAAPRGRRPDLADARKGRALGASGLSGQQRYRTRFMAITATCAASRRSATAGAGIRSDAATSAGEHGSDPDDCV